MKYTELDMQEIPRQMSPLTQVQNISNGIPDRSNWRSRHSDSTNNNGAKESPEVIDLDGEDSPIKEKVETTIAVNGVTTTVKKVCFPWQDKKTDEVDKPSAASKAESETLENAANENVLSKEMLPATPIETEEGRSSQATEGGRINKKKRFANENSQVKKRTSSKKMEVGAMKKSKNGRSQVELNSSLSQGERKRPNAVTSEESNPKRLKIVDVAVEESSSSNVTVTSQVNGLARQDSKEIVSVVDLVDEEEEEEEAAVRDEKKTSSKEENSIVVGPENVALACAVIKPKNVDSPSHHVEKVSSPSPALPVVTTPATVNVPSPAPPPSGESRTKSISSVIVAATNGILPQMQSIEVKKVKLCPSLEKQATAMSAASSLTVSTTVATPKPAIGATLVQTQVSTNATSPETAAVPPPIVTQKPSASESAKDFLKEVLVSGADVENKVGLNPAHSLTRKLVKKLTRAELEAFVLELTCDLVFTKSDAGKYHQMYEEMKEISENKSMKLAQLAKQVADLSTVVNRVVNESKERRDVIPHRLTRSVGLQLDPSNIIAAQKARARGEKLQIISPSINTSSSNTSLSSIADRSQLIKWNRSAASSTSKTMPPPTPNGPNGAVTSPVAKDATPSTSLINRSPQRQLRAIHPRVPQASAQSSLLPTTSSPSSAQPLSTSESPSKLQGFIDITEENKILNTGATIGVRRHRTTPSVIISPSSGNNGSTNATLNALTPNQVGASTLKMVQQHYGQSGNVYPQSSGTTRVVTPTTISAGPSLSGSRLTYLIPSPNTVPVQQRQLLLAQATPSTQIRGRTPVNQGSSLQTMLMRPNTLVQVSSGTITSPSTSIIRTFPTNSLQMLTPAKSQQQHASRVLAMQGRSASSSRVIPLQHPAPLPAQPQPTVVNPNLKPIPRRPVLKLSKVSNGIVLSWNMTTTTPHEEIASYQLYAYQEGANSPPSPSLWKKVGDVKALPLPMACTLTQFADGHTYHFAVRAVDVHGRVGEFSVPGTIELFN